MTSQPATIKSSKPSTDIYFVMAIVSFMLICLGFGNFYLPRVFNPEEVISSNIHIHAATFFAWMILFLVQSTLVYKRKVALHVHLGSLGFFLAIAMLASAIVTTLEITEAGHKGIPGLMFTSPEGFFLLNINAILIFTGLALTGLYFRNKPDMHKRLMLMATVLGLTPPAISRLPLVSGNEALIPVVVAIVVLAAPIYEWYTQRTFHKAYRLSMPLIIFILPPVVEILAQAIWT